MPHAPLGAVLGHVRRLAGADDPGQSDAQLLRRFVAGHNQAAFAALVRRHGRLVWGVCRHVLGHEQDAEDAFQATFLVLARRAASIREQESVGSWLYRLAHRVARRAGQNTARRRAGERQAGLARREAVPPESGWRELQEVLQEELERLPEAYRAPFVLCCLEGKSGPEAAALLGWKVGTVTGRLSRARALLRDRLQRRGVALPAVLTALALVNHGRAAACPAGLVTTAVHGALALAPGGTAGAVPEHVLSLADGVSRVMATSKVRTVTALLLAASVFVAALGVVARGALVAGEADRPPAAAPEPPAAAPEPAAPRPPDADALVVKGRVLGPDGKPFAGARLSVWGQPLGTSGPDGAFRFTLSRSKLDEGTVAKNCWTWTPLLATAEGYGPDWRALADRDRSGNLTLRLAWDDVPVTGRLLDLEGRPVAGVTVRVVRLSAAADNSVSLFLKVWRDDPVHALAGGQMGMIGFSDGEGVRSHWSTPERGPDWRTLWPDHCARLFPAATTDRDGKFRLTGLGRERLVEFVVRGPTVEQVELRAVTRRGLDVKAINRPSGKSLQRFGGDGEASLRPPLFGDTVTYLLGPTRPVTGVVRDRETGKPLAGVRVVGRVEHGKYGNTDIDTVTDGRGRYRLVGLPKDSRYVLTADPPDEALHLPRDKELGDTPGLQPLTADFDLDRGVVVEGRLLDRTTGKPVRGSVYYLPLPGNPHYGALPGGGLHWLVGAPHYGLRPDGSFKLAVFPGPGVVYASSEHGPFRAVVIAPEDEKKGIGEGDTAPVKQAQVYRLIEPKAGEQSLRLDLEFVREPQGP
jgi:RNA polymerase sigma factor (sigma-70 family)